MRKKAGAKKAAQRAAWGNAKTTIQAREHNTPLKLTKMTGTPSKTPTGKGLGKAGAKRLGRLLKRAIQRPEEPTGEGKASLPKTPVRLFKHQIQTEADRALKTNSAKPASSCVSQLIFSMVSQCKHRGGISMAELKQTLAAGGYDVTKKSRQVNVETKRLINSETLVRITRKASFRLNNKNLTDASTRVRTIPVKPPMPKEDLKQSTAASKSPKGAEKSQRRVMNAPKPKRKTHRAATGSYKHRNKTRKAANYSKQRRKTPKERRKSPKPAGKKRRSATNQAARVQKAARKAQRARKRQPKQVQYLYKCSWERQLPRQKLPKTGSRLKTRKHRDARRRTYYY